MHQHYYFNFQYQILEAFTNNALDKIGTPFPNIDIEMMIFPQMIHTILTDSLNVSFVKSIIYETIKIQTL